MDIYFTSNKREIIVWDIRVDTISRPFWSFDPYVIGVRALLIISFTFITLPSYNKQFMSYIYKSYLGLGGLIKLLFPSLDFSSLGLINYLIRMFVLIGTINLVSLGSYIYRPLAQIMLTISLRLIIWLSSIIYQIVYYRYEKAIHMTPKGTPMWLLFFIVLIEVVRQLIRPITLGVRLSANLTAGHLILTLLATGGIITSLLPHLPLVVLEMVVALVQPFVFCLLSYLYFLETYISWCNLHVWFWSKRLPDITCSLLKFVLSLQRYLLSLI